jgi:hypothetical protein
VIAREVERGVVCRHVAPRIPALLGLEAAPMDVPAEVVETVIIDLHKQAQVV